MKGLIALGFRVEGVADGVELLDLLAGSAKHYDCVVLDLTMPRMSGPECLRRLRSEYPELPVVLASGYSSETIESEILNSEWVSFLAKPFPILELRDTREASVRTVS